MIRDRTLVLPDAVHRRLERHLFPGDGKEAAAILLCSRVELGGLKLLVRDVIIVPHDKCERNAVFLTWPGDYIDIALAAAEEEDLSIILLHSHPTGFYGFSRVDDASDQDTIRSLIMAGPVNNVHEPWHGSAIMVPSGAIKARVYDRAMRAHPIDLVSAYGDDLRFFWNDKPASDRRPMAFGTDMTLELSRLSVAVIGVSGTGSVVAEQLLRMGVGELIAVDHDHVESKNLNRILNTYEADAMRESLKVEVLKRAAANIRPATSVRGVPLAIGTRTAVHAVSEADIVFCCVDSLGGRHICDRLAAAMLQPLFDVGVTIPVRTPSRGMAISNICGRIDYVKPGGATLGDRGVYTPVLLEAEYLRTVDPKAYEDRVKEGYMPGAGQEAPSVICVNMQAASGAVLEFIARAYPFRLNDNAKFEHSEFDLAAEERAHAPTDASAMGFADMLGAGLRRPLLGLPALEDAE